MIETRITFVFATEVGVKLSWREVLEAVDRHIVSNSFAQEMALAELTDKSKEALVHLAFSSVHDSVKKDIEILAEVEDSRPNIENLLFLLLTYLRRSETSERQLLDLMEEVYADFNYPQCMADFIRYMPMKGPDLGSKKANEERLVANLDAYLNRHELRQNTNSTEAPSGR